METIQQQIGALQAIVQNQQAGMKRQRFAIIALAGIIVAGGFISACSSNSVPNTFDSITCRALKVINADGNERIYASTDNLGNPVFTISDRKDQIRFLAGTDDDGGSSLTMKDKKGKMRISLDCDEKGDAKVFFFDTNEKLRVIAGTRVNGEVLLPTKDLK